VEINTEEGIAQVFCPASHPYVLGGGGYDLGAGDLVQDGPTGIDDLDGESTVNGGWDAASSVSTAPVQVWAICSQ
jgi:hypothetical protein